MKIPKFFLGSDRSIRYEDGQTTLIINGTLINQVFTGTVNLSNDLTAYNNYTVGTTLAITVGPNPVIGGSAEVRLIGDDSHTPTFTPFTKSAASADYSPTAAAINKVVFYYDGTEAFYSITIL